jgi:GNAT superfamily N-acetyltransferase
MDFDVRLARLDDRAVLETLIARSARGLGVPDYKPEQIEAALQGAFGVDTELIRDGTYFVIECEAEIVACGGWSRRATLFGGDAHAARSSRLLDPRTEAARIRAFFVDPDFARHGLGRMLLDLCSAAATAGGFGSLELMATLPGQKLYAKCGFLAQPTEAYELTPGVSIDFVPMRKVLSGQ